MKKIGVYLLIIILVLIIGCSSIETEGNKTVEEDNEALYGQALLNLNEHNLTDKEIANLDQRYNFLQKQIATFLKEEQEMSLVQFTRIKIELDFLQMRGYSSIKLIDLTADFTKAFSVAESSVEKEDYSGSSLGGRYYSLNRSIFELSVKEEELKVSEYLQIENDLVQLELDGYPVLSKVSELRTQLFKVVLNELESAIVNYEIPDVVEELELEETEEEFAEEVISEETTKTEEKEVIEEPEVEIIEKGPKTYLVKLVDGGFDMTSMKDLSTEDFDISELNINVGDTIEWKNVRQGNYKIALLVGNQKCSNIKSGFFNSGESFSWTFNETGTCWISDGIFTTQAIKIIIS
jgi:plastocyanin